MISFWLNVPFNQKGDVTPAPIPSRTQWKDSATCFLDRHEWGFLAFWITLKLSPKIRVGDEPSLGIGIPKHRSMYCNEIASSVAVRGAINSAASVKFRMTILYWERGLFLTESTLNLLYLPDSFFGIGRAIHSPKILIFFVPVVIT